MARAIITVRIQLRAIAFGHAIRPDDRASRRADENA
jgi:hypothetical protein